MKKLLLALTIVFATSTAFADIVRFIEFSTKHKFKPGSNEFVVKVLKTDQFDPAINKQNRVYCVKKGVINETDGVFECSYYTPSFDEVKLKLKSDLQSAIKLARAAFQKDGLPEKLHGSYNGKGIYQLFHKSSIYHVKIPTEINLDDTMTCRIAFLEQKKISHIICLAEKGGKCQRGCATSEVFRVTDIPDTHYYGSGGNWKKRSRWGKPFQKLAFSNKEKAIELITKMYKRKRIEDPKLSSLINMIKKENFRDLHLKLYKDRIVIERREYSYGSDSTDTLLSFDLKDVFSFRRGVIDPKGQR